MKKITALFLAIILLLGLAMPAGAATAKAATMRLEHVDGSVTAYDASGQAVAYTEGMRLYSGYTITTADASYAYISLDDTKAIKLDMNTTVNIKKSFFKLAVELVSGELFFNVTAPLSGDESLEIRTSTMVTGIRGSCGWVTPVRSAFITGHGHVVGFDVMGALTEYDVYGGEIVRGYRQDDPHNYLFEKSRLRAEDLPYFVLVELGQSPQLQAAIREAGVMDLQTLLDRIPEAKAEEDEYWAAARDAVVQPPEGKRSDDEWQIPVFTRELPPMPVPYLPPIPGPIVPVRTHTLTIQSRDDDTTEQVRPGETITLSDPEPIDGFVFLGWTSEDVTIHEDSTFTMPDKNVTVSARWAEETAELFTVTFRNDNGTVLREEQYVAGETPAFNGDDPVKDATAQYTYTFAGWTPAVVPVTGDAEYTATYSQTVNSYTITFVDEGGDILQESDFEYGETPVYSGATPTKAATAEFTYTFAGWTPEIAIVTGEATYTATYSEAKNSYTITFVDEGGAVLQESDFEYGATPVYSGAAPAKAATAEFTYTFAGWTPAIAPVTGEATYTATYSAAKNSYTITFVNEGGAVLQESDFEYGATPVYSGATPTKAATDEFTYTFAGWTPEIAIVTGEATYTATYSAAKNSYTVTWLDEDGGLIETTTVVYGVSPSHDAPTKEADGQYSYAFSGWKNGSTTYTGALPEVEGPVTYTAVFEKDQYMVSVTVPSDVSITVESGGTSTVFDTAGTHQFGYVDPDSTLTVSFTFTLSDASVSIPGPATRLTASRGTIMDGILTVVDYTEITVSNLYTILTNPLAANTAAGGYYAIVDSVNASNSVDLNGELYITSSGSLFMDAGYVVTNNGTIINEGNIIISQDGQLNNAADGLITNEGTINVQYYGVLNNYGTIDNVAEGLILVDENGTFNNYGNHTVNNYGRFFNSGTLNNGSDTDTNLTGVFNNEAGAFYFNTQDLGRTNVNAGSTFTNAGTIIKSTFIVNESGTYTNTGTEAEAGGFIGSANAYDAYWYITIVDSVGPTYELTLAGTGETEDFTPMSPWVGANYHEQIVSATVGPNITAIGTYTFRDCTALVSADLGSITQLPEGTFNGCTSLESITIPDSVTAIGNNCFAQCEKLASLDLGSGVVTIGQSAFSGCLRLASVSVPDSVETIGSYAFYACSDLETVVIGDSVTEIDWYAFTGCANLSSLTLGSSVETIGQSAFAQNKITELVIPDSVTTIEERAFYNCTELESLTLGGSVETIGDEAFYQCTALQSLSIPDSVTSIGTRAFAGCDSIQSVSIPAGVTEFGTGVFAGCGALESAVFPDNMTVIPTSIFYECELLDNVIIPESVIEIGASAFYGCTSLGSSAALTEEEAFIIPANVTSIGANAFYNSGLKVVILPDGIDTIGDAAFQNSQNLVAAAFRGYPPTTFGDDVFDGCDADFLINISAVTAIQDAWYDSDYYDSGSDTFGGFYYILYSTRIHLPTD